MNYLFVGGSIKDKAGLAMIQGAVNGIIRLDPEARFNAFLPAEHNAENHLFKTFIDPADCTEALEFANVLLDVGGIFRNQPYRCQYVKVAKTIGIPYVFMSQSFMESVDGEILNKATVIARGRRAAENAEKAMGAGAWVEVAADLSFLVQAEKWEGTKYFRAYTTHFNKPVSSMLESCISQTCVQTIWKEGYLPDGIEKYGGKPWEQKLPVRHVTGSVEKLFGLIASVREVHTARYQAACAAIKAGIKPQLFISYRPKYDDLMDFYGLTPRLLEKSAMISCRAAVEAARKRKRHGA